jgi:hypothetical protein
VALRAVIKMTIQDLGHSDSDSYSEAYADSYAGSIEAEDGGSVAGPLVNFVGAVVSIGLIGGIGVWGYQLLVRDVTGVPVVRAIQGDMRETPVSPGGAEADYQGLAVNEVAAENLSSEPIEQVILAPQPIELNEEDRTVPDIALALATMGEVVEPAVENAVQVMAVDAIDDAVADALVDLSPAAAQAQDGTQASALALAEMLTAGIQPLSNGQVIEGALVQTASFVAPQLARPQFAMPESAFNSRSPMPRPRPAPSQRAVVQASAPAPVAVPVEVAPETIATGSRLVQLGAYASPEVARAEWSRISGNFGALFEPHQRVVQKAESRGKTFYRLRVSGFDDLADARRFCAVLTSKKADCIPVAVK